MFEIKHSWIGIILTDLNEIKWTEIKWYGKKKGRNKRVTKRRERGEKKGKERVKKIHQISSIVI